MPDPTNEYWGSDEEFPATAWKAEVANGDTRLGYWAWVQHMKLQQRTE